MDPVAGDIEAFRRYRQERILLMWRYKGSVVQRRRPTRWCVTSQQQSPEQAKGRGWCSVRRRGRRPTSGPVVALSRPTECHDGGTTAGRQRDDSGTSSRVDKVSIGYCYIDDDSFRCP